MVEDPAIGKQGWLRAIFWVNDKEDDLCRDLFWKKTNAISIADRFRARRPHSAFEGGVEVRAEALGVVISSRPRQHQTPWRAFAASFAAACAYPIRALEFECGRSSRFSDFHLRPETCEMLQ